MAVEVDHNHQPIYRVVKAHWRDPLDTSFSRGKPDNRWNPPERFEVLYTCCSVEVARAIVQDVLRDEFAVSEEDLLESALPNLCEIEWSGTAVDVASEHGVSEAGFGSAYPEGVDRAETQAKAAEWHEDGEEGVACRSASMYGLGWRDWSEPHLRWGELAIFVENATMKPALIRRRTDREWLLPPELTGD